MRTESSEKYVWLIAWKSMRRRLRRWFALVGSAGTKEQKVADLRRKDGVAQIITVNFPDGAAEIDFFKDGSFEETLRKSCGRPDSHAEPVVTFLLVAIDRGGVDDRSRIDQTPFARSATLSFRKPARSDRYGYLEIPLARENSACRGIERGLR